MFAAKQFTVRTLMLVTAYTALLISVAEGHYRGTECAIVGVWLVPVALAAGSAGDHLYGSKPRPVHAGAHLHVRDTAAARDTRRFSTRHTPCSWGRSIRRCSCSTVVMVAPPYLGRASPLSCWPLASCMLSSESDFPIAFRYVSRVPNKLKVTGGVGSSDPLCFSYCFSLHEQRANKSKVPDPNGTR